MNTTQLFNLSASNSQTPKYTLISVDELTMLIGQVKNLVEEVNNLKNHLNPQRPLSSKEVMEILNIKERLLKKYRDDGLLAYSQIGDKYWYTYQDVANFLAMSKVESLYNRA